MHKKNRIEDIKLSHGSGGVLMHRLVDSVFIKNFDNAILRQKKDSAIIDIGGKTLAFTTDSYVVKPIFFPGGDIGSLAVFGTVNDLSVCGARPLYLSLGLIIEEGLSGDLLRDIVDSISKAARVSGVKVVTGDTKVVEKGSCDKIFISTSGIGEVYYKGLAADSIEPGDAVIISASIGEHAVSVLSKREGIDFNTKVKSDSRPLYGMIRDMLKASSGVKFMRDPTRGGLATTLNEIVKDMPFGIEIREEAVPVKESVRGACELLGFDPMYLACEGVFVAIVDKKDVKRVLRTIRKDRNGRMSSQIGVVTGYAKGKVSLKTSSGGQRLMDMLTGEQLPRIC